MNFDPAIKTGIQFQTTQQLGMLMKVFNVQTFVGNVRFIDCYCKFAPVKNSQFVNMGPAINQVGGAAFNYLWSQPVFETTYPYIIIPPFDQINLDFNIPAATGTITVVFSFGIDYIS